MYPATRERGEIHTDGLRTLPPFTYANTVDVVGSWDNFGTATPLEQDRRVGRDVWKTILTLNGGLEMGSEHYYYVCTPTLCCYTCMLTVPDKQFLLDRKHIIPDPQSPPSSLMVQPRTGRLLSVLFVPVELPPSPTVKFAQQMEQVEAAVSSPTIVGSLLFADFDGESDDVMVKSFEQPQPQQPRQIENNNNRKRRTFRERLRVRRSFLGSPGLEEEHKPKRRRGWGLQLSVSTAFLRMGYRSSASDGDEVEGEDINTRPPQRDDPEIADIVGYLRSNDDAATPKAAPRVISVPITQSHSASSSVCSQNPGNTSPSPGMYSSFYSSEDDEDEVATPVDITFPKYYNFDELKCGDAEVEDTARSSGGESTAPSLKCLREQVGGEMAWQQEIVSEHGYLGSVVV